MSVPKVDNDNEHQKEQIGMDRTDDEPHMVNVPADLLNYGKRELIDGQLLVEASAAAFVDKGEDRHCAYYGHKQMGM